MHLIEMVRGLMILLGGEMLSVQKRLHLFFGESLKRFEVGCSWGIWLPSGRSSEAANANG